MTDIQKYLSGDIKNIMDYRRFNQGNELDDDKVLGNIKNFITTQVKDILLIHIDEDKLFLTKRELDKLPQGVRHYLDYSEHRGIKFYVFTTKNGDFRTAIGVFGGSTGRANEHYFDQIIADKQYEKITNTVSMRLTDLLKG